MAMSLMTPEASGEEVMAVGCTVLDAIAVASVHGFLWWMPACTPVIDSRLLLPLHHESLPVPLQEEEGLHAHSPAPHALCSSDPADPSVRHRWGFHAAQRCQVKAPGKHRGTAADPHKGAGLYKGRSPCRPRPEVLHRSHLTQRRLPAAQLVMQLLHPSCKLLAAAHMPYLPSLCSCSSRTC